MHVPLQSPQNNGMGASPDGLVVDPGEADDPYGLLEIKCPARAEKTSLLGLATKKEVCSSFFLNKRCWRGITLIIIKCKVSFTLLATPGVTLWYGHLHQQWWISVLSASELTISCGMILCFQSYFAFTGDLCFLNGPVLATQRASQYTS